MVPRQVTIDLAGSTVTWDGLGTTVAAEVTERMIKFQYDGFDYLISRLTGQIRFSNPSELARWSEYRKRALRAAALRGQSTAQADIEVTEELNSKLTAREQVGDCAPASAPKF